MKEKKKQSAAVVVATVLTVTSVMSPVASVYANETDTAIAQQTETVQIKENAPPITLPQKLVGNEGQTLQDIVLPENWKWSDETTVISEGRTDYPARISVDDVTYDYSDVEGYSPEGHYVERMVMVTVEPAKPEPEEPVQKKSNRLLGNAQTAFNTGDIAIIKRIFQMIHLDNG